MNDFGIIPASSPSPTTLPTTSGNSFGIIAAPPIDYEKRRKEEERKKLEQEARKAQAEAQFNSSTVGKVTNTIKEFGNETFKDLDNMSKYIVSTYKSTPGLILKDIDDAMKDVKSGAKDIAGGVGKIAQGDFKAGKQQISQGKNEAYYGVAIKGGVRPISRISDAIFSPLSSFLAVALGEDSGVGKKAGQIVTKTGEVVADKTGIVDKDKFKAYLSEHHEGIEDFLRVVDIASNFIGGKAVDVAMTKKALPEAMETFSTNLAKNAAEETTETTLSVLSKEERYAKYRKEQGYEPYADVDELPVIQMGAKEKSSMPVIQTGESIRVTKNTKGDFVYEPIKDTPVKKPKVTEPTPTIESTPTPTEVTPDKVSKVNRISKDLNEFEGQTNAQQIAEIEAMDVNIAKKVALGKMESPNGIPSTAYLAVLENQADELAKTGDYSLAMELADSNLGKKAGQNLQAMNIASKDSFVGILRDLKNSMEEALPKTAKKNKLREVQSIKDNLNNTLNDIDIAKPPKNMIEKALSELICKDI